jgi:hypothetical protein
VTLEQPDDILFTELSQPGADEDAEEAAAARVT